MPSIASSRKRIGTALLDDTAIGFDLISQLTYMSAVAASGVARDMIMEEAGQQPFRTAIYFRNVFLLVKRMGIEYTRAFQVIAQAAPTEGLRHLLLRFSGAVATGGSEADFIRAETPKVYPRYKRAGDRILENFVQYLKAY